MSEVQDSHYSLVGEQQIACEPEQDPHIPVGLGRLSIDENSAVSNSRNLTYPIYIPRPPIKSRQGGELRGRPSSRIAGRTKLFWLG